MQLLYYIYEEPVTIHLGTWISLGDIVIPFGLSLDSLAMTVIVPVGIITLCVLAYAIEYMSHDPNRNRFYIILSIFAVFMTILVVSDNYLMMFIGWEFVGVISYLLISFWSTRITAMKSALSMVCAGVYVLVRSYMILEYTPTMLLIICWLGGLTTLVSGLIAIVTNDIKRVIALSTMSQLSIMVLAIGISAYDLAIYHLYCHAFFKALLFMGAGSVIHSFVAESQDMRKYGGLIEYLPFSYTAILIASLSLMAIPIPTLSDATVLYTPVVYVICAITIIYTSIITLRQTDLKVIVAYSSISHMAVCILGILSNSLAGINGSLILSLAHGFVSPALFIIVGGILYDRYHHRLIYYYQGLLTYMPILAIYLLILSFRLSLTGAIGRSTILGCISAFSVLLSAAYMLKVTNRLTGGIRTPYTALTSDCTYRESLLMIALIIPTLWYGLYPNGIINMIWQGSKLLYIFVITQYNVIGNI